MNILLFSLSFSYLIYVWIHTNAFIEYYEIFGADSWGKANKYIEDTNRNGRTYSFQQYLLSFYDTEWHIRLITCPYCLAGVLGLLTIPILGLFCFASSFLMVVFYLTIKILTKYSSQ